MKSAFLFDLDGTLTDPKPGITGCIVYAMERLGLPCPPAEELNWSIGPPLKSSFEKLLGVEGRNLVDQAVAFYRERFTTVGLFENSVYPGIPAALAEIRATSRPLYLATSKPRIYAERILCHFRLDSFFDRSYGSELDGTRTHKGELIAYILATERLNAKDCLMIGDREFDIIGARENAMDSLGVLWGYGSFEELTKAGATRLCTQPSELAALLAL